jgi:mRNA-degrading endonuclease RelE of RelBE toxin-antitoxin system
MGVKYQIHYLEEVVKKHIPSLCPYAKVLIKRAIEERLMIDPISFGKPLRYTLKGYRRLRVSDYRIVYRIETKTVIIVAIKHRRDVQCPIKFTCNGHISSHYETRLK